MVCTLLVTACAQLMLSGPKDLPMAVVTGPVTYRDLSTIPPRPIPASTEENARSIEVLSKDREEAQQEASRLRAQPFAQPAPAPRLEPEVP